MITFCYEYAPLIKIIGMLYGFQSYSLWGWKG